MAFWNLIESATTKLVRVTAKTENTAAEAPVSRPTELHPIDEFFLFLTFLSTGFNQLELTHRFKIHRSAVSRIIATWANFLYCVLGSLSVWTSPAALLASSPPSDSGGVCDNTEIVLECVKLRCQMPSSLLVRSEGFPGYKSHCAVKAIAGVSPRGAIVFVSSLFEGSMSDGAVFRRSGVTSLLPPDAAVTVDEGFRGDDLAPGSDRPSNTPPARRPRAHVERAIRRVKENKLFDCVPLSVAGSINQIFTVACLLSNYQHGLVV